MAKKDEGGSGRGWGIRESTREIRKQSLALGRDTGRRSRNSKNEGNNLFKRAAAFLMQFRKWPHYLREGKPRHLRVNGSSELETPLGCMALMQTTSPQGERGALGLESPLGWIIHAVIQTETHLPYLQPDHDQ